MGNPVIHVLTRGLAEEHATRLLELIGEIPGRPWSRAELLAPRPGKFELSRVWVDGADAIGVIIATNKGRSVHIHQVVFANAYRRIGLGRTSYAAIAATAQSAGKSELTANCIAEDKAAMNFHESLGFTQQGVYRDPDDSLKYAQLAVPVVDVLARSGR